MTTWDETRNDPVALRTYLDGLDARLAGDGVAIPARSFHAWSAVQKDMRICVALGDPSMKPVDDYFAAKYGRRRLLDPSVGRMLVLFGHDAWSLRFPLVFGRVRVDLLRMIDDGTPDLMARLTKAECAMLEHLVPRGFEAFNALRRVPLDLRVDWPAAVDQAVDPRGDFGLSKWSSQQVVEKMLKAFIARKGGVVEFTHHLERVAVAAESLGLPALDRRLLAQVECRPGIRYPGNGATLHEAVVANQASVFLCGEIAKQW